MNFYMFFPDKLNQNAIKRHILHEGVNIADLCKSINLVDVSKAT